MDYRNTLNLPQTSFPMRANLPQREPEYVKRWESMDLYRAIRESRKDRELFVLHDGPPYANGAIHLGTGLNKILKDMVCKSKLPAGLNYHYRPGWDCHGLPIELNVTQALGEDEKKTISITALRKKCRNYALKFVDKHRASFKRLGVIGDWERPYLTLAPGYEAEELRQFAALVERGCVYQGLKPIHWCASCQTALAEAEVEYGDHNSPSIYVRFPFEDESLGRVRGHFGLADGKPVHAVIWTTTPWTLPANRAVCLHPNFVYKLIPLEGEYLLAAAGLIPRVIEETGVQPAGGPVGNATGKELEDLRLSLWHPLAELTVPVISGTHVTLEQGTGAVHTAPGHGQEDYIIGQQYGLEVFAPVDAAGRLTDESPICAGAKVAEANEPIIAALGASGRLLHRAGYKHSYPFCWRCKNPIIFRATRQWFVSLEEGNLRQRLLDAIDKVAWIPSWGRQRIRAMVENRQEWCISRQRAWGVPIPAVYFSGSPEGIVDAELIRELAGVVAKESTEFWFRAIEDPSELNRLNRVKELLPEGKTLEDVHLEKDILDVWFDSGASHHSVMAQDEGIYPADMYLEGSDQHRGWFQSALIIAIAAGCEPPYRSVLTHGFTVDENGRKLSKSLGNFVILDDLVKETGADVIRLWVASEDFRNDMSFSPEILKRVTEAYRRIRNTARFLLGNISDFAPDERVAEEDRHEIDRWAMNRWRDARDKILNSYARYDFHRIFYEINNFCSVDLSARYLDIIKDRLYVSGKRSMARKSAQSTLAEIAVELTVCAAPILSFTCEEIWDHLRESGLVSEPSVFLRELGGGGGEIDRALLDEWEKLFLFRAEAAKAIETHRKRGTIGHSLDSQVTVDAPDGEWRQLFERAAARRHGDDPASLCIVSDFRTGPIENGPDVYGSVEIPGLRISVGKAPGHKCPRCWHYDPAVDEGETGVCPRCKDVLESEASMANAAD